MISWYRIVCVVGFFAVASVDLAWSGTSEYRSPDLLDKLWEQHMLEGKPSSVGIFVEGSTISVSESSRKKRLLDSSQRRGWIETLHLEPYGIGVTQLGEGFWGNGGWHLLGGMLEQVTDELSTVQLYAKIARYAHPYFPFNHDPPTDTGYEFFLLHRKQGSSGATIVRTWRFPPEEVASEESGHGGRTDKVRAFFTYDPSIQTATVRVTGLTHSFEEHVDLFSVIQGVQQQPPAAGEVTK